MQRNSSSFNAGTRMTAWFAAVLAIACVGLISTHADQINYVMVPVGNAGNTADTNTGGLYGAVSYNYQIGA